MVPLPQNLPLLLAGATPDQQSVLERVLKRPEDLLNNLLELGRHWKIRVRFSHPVELYGISRWTHWKKNDEGKQYRTFLNGRKIGTEHIIPEFFLSGDSLCYKLKREGRKGHYFPSLKLVTSYEPVIESDNPDTFNTYEEFRKKFDLMFITESEIQKLWNGKSSQHGHQYQPSDFHKIGPVGKKVLKDFLSQFKGVSSTDRTGYCLSECFKPDEVYRLERNHRTYHRFGRDICVSHQTNCDYVFYSSEYQDCCNGRYGLVANKNEFLWLEDD